MLVAMARAAANSNRKDIIFEPYPSVVDPANTNQLAFSPEVCFTVRWRILSDQMFTDRNDKKLKNKTKNLGRTGSRQEAVESVVRTEKRSLWWE